MRGLVVYSDYVCPFCYLAWPALRALGEAGWEVELRAFELAPPGVPLRARVGAGERLQWERLVAPRAASLGLEARPPAFQARTRKAHELARHARQHGLAAAAHEVLFAAYYRRGLDIGRIDVLASLGEELGLERGSVKVELDIDQYADAVREEAVRAVALGVSAVPTYLVPDTGRVHRGLLGAGGLADWLAGGEPSAGAACGANGEWSEAADDV